MKILQHATSGFALLLAGSVTAGSMYITIDAAVDSSSAEAAVEPAAETSVVEVANIRRMAGSQTVVLGADGTLNGRLGQISTADGQLVPAANLLVKLVSEGKLVASTTTNEEGVFTAKNLKPGNYGVVAGGQNGYVAYGFNAVLDRTGNQGNAASTGAIDGLQLNTAVVPPRDFAAVRRLISERFRRNADAADTAPTNAVASGVADADAGNSQPAVTISHHKIQLTPDGRLGGKLTLLDPATGASYPVTDLTVYFVKDGTLISSATVNEDGSFEVAELKSGLYSVVAAGNDGVLAFAIDAISAEQVAGQPGTDGYVLTSIAQSLDISGAPVSAGNFSASGETSPEPSSDDGSGNPVAGAPPGAAPGGGGGAAGGGGGSGGGGGGLGTILGAAGAALGAAALADNNNNNPVSP